MKNILGLDLGTNSIGWSLVEKDEIENNGRIIKAGSRIIPMDQTRIGDFEKGNPVSQTADRTKWRGARRLRERNLLRRERLLRVLNVLGFLPEHFAVEIDFEDRLGKFKTENEPKIAYYKINEDDKNYQFLFKNSFEEMLNDFKVQQPDVIADGKKIPYDWTLYYLRNKALTQRIEKEELAWLLLNFNQKRGYYQLRGEEEEEKENKRVEYFNLLVTDVIETTEKKANGEIWYNVMLENGMIYRRTSKLPLFNWKGTYKEFIVTTDLDENGNVKKDKDGIEKRSFRAPKDDDWTLVKKKTEFDIENSGKTVGTYIYETLLKTPSQKIRGKLVRTIERKYYKQELDAILKFQLPLHAELSDNDMLKKCAAELYRSNEIRRKIVEAKDFLHLFIDDILFYQRPLKSKKSLISNCKLEFRTYIKDGAKIKEPIKCVAKSNPLFQEFRLWQFVHNLRIYERERVYLGKTQLDVDVTDEYLPTPEKRAELFETLNDKDSIKQSVLLGLFFKKKNDVARFRWNYVDDAEKTYPCNETRNAILNKLGASGISDSFLTKEKEYELWHILYSVEDKQEIKKAFGTFAKKYSLPEAFIDNFMKIKPFKKDYGSYSEKAIKKMLPLMRQGQYWNEADILPDAKIRIVAINTRLKSIDYTEKRIEEVADDDIKKQVLRSFLTSKERIVGLNTYQASYAIYGKHSEASEINYWKTPADIENFLKEFKQHSLRNPIVEQVITETLRVVKDIWVQYGNGAENFFDEVHIELGREMKNTADDRKRISETVNNNENTNSRIRALLMELANDSEVQNVRPYSPSQQEILKLYEEGALLSENNAITEEILKISKLKQPSKSELIRYKLWLEQKYRSPYTGQTISLNKLFTSEYQIEHIIPQARYFDDSLSNKVICEAEVNKEKSDSTGYEFIADKGGSIIELNFGKKITLFTIEAYEDFVKKNYAGNKTKMKKLLMEEIPDSFIDRQLNDTRHISKLVKNLLSNLVREQGEEEVTSKNVISSNGNITSILKQDWGLNDVWNAIIAPRFERLNMLTNSTMFGNRDNGHFRPQVPEHLAAGFNKKRIDHRHHALDAIVIACATRNHINYLNNEHAKAKEQKTRYELKHKLCFKQKTDDQGNYKWLFYKPWQTFTQDTQNTLLNTVVSFKQNLRVINKTVNRYKKFEPDATGKLKLVTAKQTQGESWAIRKPMHKETYSGKISLRKIKEVQLSAALDNWENLVDKSLKQTIKTFMSQKMEKKKIIDFFKNLENKWNGNDISRVKIYYWETDLAATRTAVNDSFTEKYIQENITDTGIQQILLNHLRQEKYQKQTDDKGNKIEPHTVAFTPEGIEEMNKNMLALNNGKFHKPIYKVRKYETLGNKFQVGQKKQKANKYVEAQSGTNLYFAVYANTEGKRYYETIPLNEVMERLKQKLSPVNELYIDPSIEDITNKTEFNIANLHVQNIYKVVSFTNNRLYVIPNTVSSVIIDKYEYSQLNKLEFVDGKISAKEFCHKLKSNRIGRII